MSGALARHNETTGTRNKKENYPPHRLRTRSFLFFVFVVLEELMSIFYQSPFTQEKLL
jgi:hypothetical protein